MYEFLSAAAAARVVAGREVMHRMNAFLEIL